MQGISAPPIKDLGHTEISRPGDNGPRLEMWAIDRVKPYDKNPRTLPDKAIAKIAGSLKAFGFQKPIVVDADGVVVAGHAVLKAAQQAGFDRVPVFITGLDATAARAYRLADNRTAQETDWLDELLGGEILALDAAEFALDSLGFDDDELRRLLGEAANADIANGTGSLSDRFGIAPFSVLNAREGWWQERKRTWLAIGIQSEVGRGESAGQGLTMSDTINCLKPAADQPLKNSKAAKNGAVPGGGAKPPFTAKAPASSTTRRPADG